MAGHGHVGVVEGGAATLLPSLPRSRLWSSLFTRHLDWKVHLMATNRLSKNAAHWVLLLERGPGKFRFARRASAGGRPWAMACGPSATGCSVSLEARLFTNTNTGTQGSRSPRSSLTRKADCRRCSLLSSKICWNACV